MIRRWFLLVAVMVIAVLVIKEAMGRETVEFELCHYPSGEAVGPVTIEGAHAQGKAPIYSDQVQLLMPLKGDKCTLLVLQNQNQAYVVGGYREVLCKLHGGQNCTVKNEEVSNENRN